MPTLDQAQALQALELLRAEQAKRHEESPAEIVRRYKHDPLGFVMNEWPWGKADGPLVHASGPDALQSEFLNDLGKKCRENSFDGHTPVKPIMMAISSANGTGKSTLGAWICWWILRTRPMSNGTVTAGNFQQLEERTWADICYWGKIGRGAQYFNIQKSGIFHKDPKLEDKWKVTPKTAKPENAQSFAGQHASTSTSWSLVDEASEVPDPNWHAMYSTLTDGEPMMFAWGQMMKSYGEFYRNVFGEGSYKWDCRIWDGRKSAFTSKQIIQDWADEWGEDSDYFRVHALGLPPKASSLQFISEDLVNEARKRDIDALEDEPLVVGFDAANGGLAKFVFWFRRGLDAKSIPPVSLPGDTPRDAVVAKAAEIMSDKRPGRRVTAMFGDQAFGSVILERLRSSGFKNVFEVNFGDPSHDKHYLYMRSQMWATMKEWLSVGAIYDDDKVTRAFTSPGFHHRNGKLVLESKADMAKRKVTGLDFPDALALTFARKVAISPTVTPQRVIEPVRQRVSDYSWMGALIPFVLLLLGNAFIGKV